MKRKNKQIIQSLDEAIDAKEIEIARLSDIIVGYSSRINDQVKEISRLNDLLIGLNSRLSTQGESIAEFRRENENLRIQSNQIGETNKKLIQEAATLRTELFAKGFVAGCCGDKEKEIEKLKSDNDRLKVDIELLKNKMSVERDWISVISNENSDLKAAITASFRRGYEQAQADFKYMKSSGKNWWRIFK